MRDRVLANDNVGHRANLVEMPRRALTYSRARAKSTHCETLPHCRAGPMRPFDAATVGAQLTGTRDRPRVNELGGGSIAVRGRRHRAALRFPFGHGVPDRSDPCG